jgi:ubiquitin-conjugating enzyme E2 O
VVQSVNSVDRTALILFVDTGLIELVSLLELDPHGLSDSTAGDSHILTDGFGVRIGDYVFIHREGTSNGLQKPRIPRIGEVEAWVREPPIQQDGQLAGWRSEMSALGTDIAKRRGGIGYVEDGCIKRVTKDSGCLSWFGEVTRVTTCICDVFALLTDVLSFSCDWTGLSR